MPSPTPAQTVDPTLPRVVGGFRLVRELGRGGMGVVYEAEELSSGRAVALKVLAADLRVSAEAFERFRRESRLAASISDSRCVFVYGAHQIDGSPAIAMELCPGETLEHRLAKGEPIAIQTAVRWTLEVLEGLEAAHKAGVVHRDVKPSNLFITHDDHVKVGDFGLSRSLDTDVRLTQSGAFLGSPLYAAPEQIKGREVDLRSDIYSCGATLYALLSGRAPFGGQNIGEVLARILSESPQPLRSLRPDVPAELERVVARAMEREPERRFQDHAAFRAALESLLTSEVVPATRVKRLIAFALDFLLVAALVQAIVLFAIGQGWLRVGLDPEQTWMSDAFVATLLLGCVRSAYFALCEGLTGASVAKWMLGQRVVAVRTGRPSFARGCARALVFFVPGLVLAWLLQRMVSSSASVGAAQALMTPVNYLSWLVMSCSMWRRNGLRGLHELASGTRVVQARSPFARFKDTRPVPVHLPQPTDAWPAEIGSYRMEGTLGPTPTGTLLQGVDQSLNRPVWIYARNDLAAPSSEERRSLARPGRLRWLDSIRHEAALFEMFEAPGGSSLCACIAQRTSFDWPTSLRLLSGLADELASLPACEERSRSCVEQLWIDRMWSMRVLDEPIGTGDQPLRAPLEVLSDAAHMLLQDRDHPERVLPAGLPTSAEPAARKLLGHGASFASVEEASRELKALASRPVRVSAATRAAQIAVSVLVPGMMLVSVLLALFALVEPLDRQMEGLRAIRQLRAQDAAPAPPERMDDDDRRARALLIAHASADKLWNTTFFKDLDAAEVEIQQRAIAAQPAPTAEDVAWARERFRARSFPSQTSDAPSTPESPNLKKSLREVRWQLLPLFTAIVLGAWGFASLLFALILRGGLSLRVFGLSVRDQRGELASRLRCAWRSLVISLPLCALYSLATRLAWSQQLAAGMLVMAATASIHALALAYAISRPSRSIQDRLAGTSLVPR